MIYFYFVALVTYEALCVRFRDTCGTLKCLQLIHVNFFFGYITILARFQQFFRKEKFNDYSVVLEIGLNTFEPSVKKN